MRWNPLRPDSRLAWRVTVAAAAALALSAGSGVLAVDQASAAPGCSVKYVANTWNTGFVATVEITNGGDPLGSWQLTFSFPGDQRITNAWNAVASQAGQSVTLANAPYNASLATNVTTSLGFQGTYSGSNADPSGFALNGTTCNGGPGPTTTTTSGGSTTTTTPGTTTTTTPGTTTTTRSTTTTTRSTTTTTRSTTTTTTIGGAANSMGFIGCSMGENVSQGYVAVGGKRMWGPYGTGGLVVQSWTDTNSAAWQKFDQQVAKFGRPSAVWVQICIFANPGATYNEVKQLIANARQHAASGATIYITGQPLYDAGHSCTLAGADGPQLTDSLARQAGSDSTQNVIYPGAFRLHNGEDQDGCHANATGQQSLGRQALGFWG